MNPANIENDIRAKIHECLETLRRQFNRPLTCPRLNFYTLTGTTAGQYWPNKNEIRFNFTLVKENYNHFIRQTVPHELAHAIAHQLYGRVQSHGQEWKNIMFRLGVPATRCHHYCTKNSQSGATFKYVCACQTHHVSTLIHSKIQSGQKRICKKCRSAVKYVPNKPAEQTSKQTTGKVFKLSDLRKPLGVN